MNSVEVVSPKKASGAQSVPHFRDQGKVTSLADTSKPRPPLWTTEFITVTVLNLLIFFSFQMISPVMPVYVRRALGGSDVAVGVLAGVFTISAVIARPFVGLLLDLIGRRLILLISMLVFCLGIFGYGLVGGLLALAVFRVVHGFGFAGTSTATSTMAADVVPRSRRTEGLGYFGMSSTAVGAIAPTLGFWLSEQYSYPILFDTSVAFGLLALLMIFRTRDSGIPPSVPPPISSADLKRPSPLQRFRGLLEPAALPAAAVTIVMSMTYGASQAFIALFAPQVGLENPGTYFLVFALAIMTSRPLAGTLADRFGTGPVLIPAIALVSTSFLVTWQATSVFVLLFAAVMFGLGFGALVPVLLAVSITRAPDHRRGAATATFYTAFDLGIAIGSTAMGPIAQNQGYAAVFGACSIIAFVGLALFVWLRPMLQEPEQQEEPSIARTP